MTREETRAAFIAAQKRRDQLYQWYTEKSNRGFHKEFSFEELKRGIAKAELEVDRLEDALATNDFTNENTGGL